MVTVPKRIRVKYLPPPLAYKSSGDCNSTSYLAVLKLNPLVVVAGMSMVNLPFSGSIVNLYSP
jgi:hypothetical protein